MCVCVCAFLCLETVRFGYFESDIGLLGSASFVAEVRQQNTPLLREILTHKLLLVNVMGLILDQR